MVSQTPTPLPSDGDSVRTPGAPAGPGPLVVGVAGTGTEVGKTWVTVELTHQLLDAGWLVSARKPVESFDPSDDPARRDSAVLAAATGESPEAVCPSARRYPMAMAPPIAARLLGRDPIGLGELVAEHLARRSARRVDVELVELAGGVGSPLANAPAPDLAALGDGGAPGDGGAQFLALLGTHLDVLVADASLGAIDAVRTHLWALGVGRTEAPPSVVFLNRYRDDSVVCVENRRWLEEVDGLLVATTAAELAGHVLAAKPAWCTKCGKISCAGGCRDELEADRFCSRCGRKLAVQISPVRTRSTCSVHGALT